MHPTANPIASVNASRRGDIPWRRNSPAFRFMVSRVCIGSLTFNSTQIDANRIQSTVKLLYTHQESNLLRDEVPTWHCIVLGTIRLKVCTTGE